MRFVTVTHPEIGEARVPESTVPHLPDGWTVVDDDQAAADPPAGDSTLDPAAEIDETETPTSRATRARTSPKES